MKLPELLAPVGDFECLKAAVQNSADSIYLGASSFSARASATNFNLDELKEAISYAKLRNVDVHLTLNTLLQENEIEPALELAKNAYEFGIDAIIVQDLGLADLLMKTFPDLPIHASTQMTIHNLEGAKKLEKLGFKRIVLARELSIDEIKYICENTTAEIEMFAHGALCISCSGRCYISSMIGGRSGNRGKCAQACRLPYKLYSKESPNLPIDKGYLLSPRDLCSLEYLPEILKTGVDCLKIEGRMKTPEYVATVTRIYRKYIDMAMSNEQYIVDEQDKKDLMQVFNRGGFSSGHLENASNKKLIYPIRSNNMGLYLGKVQKFQSGKGYITFEPKEKIEIGDTITFEHENTKYTISELMQRNKNIKEAQNQLVQIGRMKGNIKVGDKIYKMASKSLSKFAKDSYEKENKKIPLDCKITIKENQPISLSISPCNINSNNIYKDLYVEMNSDIIPQKAIKTPITPERIEENLRKTGNTEFSFNNIDVDLGENLYVPSISGLNELRRNALNKLENLAIQKFTRHSKNTSLSSKISEQKQSNKNISLLLNNLNLDYDYSKLHKVDYVYIPLSYYLDENYKSIIKQFSNTYIYLPSIIRKNKVNYVKKAIQTAIDNFEIKGCVYSNLSDLELLPPNYNLEKIANYTLNMFNTYTYNKLHELGFNRITISPELSEAGYNSLSFLDCEAIVYGNLPIMTLNYCLLGKANKCYSECNQACKQGKYFLRDRMDLDFPLVPNSTYNTTTIYNSKTTSIIPSLLPASTYRIDILDESFDEINNIIDTVNLNSRLEGKGYTSNNLNREI